MPIHLGMHWTLVVIDFDFKEIRYYDSMNGKNYDSLRGLSIYLKEEYNDKKKSSAKFDLN